MATIVKSCNKLHEVLAKNPLNHSIWKRFLYRVRNFRETFLWTLHIGAFWFWFTPNSYFRSYCQSVYKILTFYSIIAWIVKGSHFRGSTCNLKCCSPYNINSTVFSELGTRDNWYSDTVSISIFFDCHITAIYMVLKPQFETRGDENFSYFSVSQKS